MKRFLLTFFLCAVILLSADLHSQALVSPNSMIIPKNPAELPKDVSPSWQTRVEFDSATALPRARFDYDHGQIVQRHFYSYAPTQGITEESIDNGSSEDEMSTDGVSFCRIIRHSRLGNAPGICSMLEEFEVNVANRERTLVRRMFNIHNEQNLLIQQDVFSPKRQLLYSWRYSYDGNGQLVKSTFQSLSDKAQSGVGNSYKRPAVNSTVKGQPRRWALGYASHTSDNDGGPRLFDFFEPTQDADFISEIADFWEEYERTRAARYEKTYNTYCRRCRELIGLSEDYANLRWTLIRKYFQPLESVRAQWEELISMLGTDLEQYEPYSRLKARAYELPEYGESFWEWDFRQGFASVMHVLDLAEMDGCCEEQIGFYRNEIEELKSLVFPPLEAFEEALVRLHAHMQLLDPRRFATLAQYRNTYHEELDAIQQEELLKFWTAVLKHYPQHPVANRWNGMTLAKQGDYDTAALYLTNAVSFLPIKSKNQKLRADLLSQCGFLHIQNSAYSEALRDLDKALGFNPYLEWAYLDRAASYFEMGCFEDAINDYRALRALSFDPPDLVLGDLQKPFAIGLRDGVLEGMQQAIVEIVPSLYSTFSGMGQFCWAMLDSQYRDHVTSKVIEYFDYLRTLDPEILKQTLMHSAYELVNTSEQTPPEERGQIIGKIVGHFGVDILLPGACIKTIGAVARFQEIKRINLIATLHEISANSIEAKLLLKKSLYSQEFFAQALDMKYPGTVIAGVGHKDEIRGLQKIISLYGGTKNDWVKKVSGTYNVTDLFGTPLPEVYLQGKRPGWYRHVVSCHWYENINTNKRYELKINLFDKVRD